MNQISVRRRRTVTACAAALLAVSSLAAGCGNSGKEAPSSTPSPATSSAPVSPTEKSLSPNGGNKFTPTVVAPPPPTMPPGNHHHGLGGG